MAADANMMSRMKKNDIGNVIVLSPDLSHELCFDRSYIFDTRLDRRSWAWVCITYVSMSFASVLHSRKHKRVFCYIGGTWKEDTKVGAEYSTHRSLGQRIGQFGHKHVCM